jgi:nucleoside-triphosphatase
MNSGPAPSEKQNRIWIITGDPGSGKTTVVSRILLDVKSAGYTVGGMLTREIRSRGERLGFRIVNLATEEGWTLASVELSAGPRVGKYRVDLKNLARVASESLGRAKQQSDLLVCDEIGPMELFSPEFRRAVSDCIINSEKPSLCVVHKRLQDPLIEQLREKSGSVTYEVTYENRSTLPKAISSEILGVLELENAEARQGE